MSQTNHSKPKSFSFLVRLGAPGAHKLRGMGNQFQWQAVPIGLKTSIQTKELTSQEIRIHALMEYIDARKSKLLIEDPTLIIQEKATFKLTFTYNFILTAHVTSKKETNHYINNTKLGM